MAKDKLEQHYRNKEKKGVLGSLFKKTVDPDLLSEEETMLENTAPVEPIQAAAEPGRNDPCPCGSGKKFKKCCANKD
jgi:uncharacterized protein YecA (UPF0149 family)